MNNNKIIIIIFNEITEKEEKKRATDYCAIHALFPVSLSLLFLEPTYHLSSKLCTAPKSTKIDPYNNNTEKKKKRNREYNTSYSF